jgi:type II secretory pathway pseudopilin PulG
MKSMNKNHYRHNQSGFTLVEAVIAIGLLGIVLPIIFTLTATVGRSLKSVDFNMMADKLAYSKMSEYENKPWSYLSGYTTPVAVPKYNNGSCSATTATLPLDTGIYDQTVAAYTDYNWTQALVSGWYCPSYAINTGVNATDTATFRFVGDSVKISSITGPDKGIMSVKVGAQAEQIVDLYSPSASLLQVVFTNTPIYGEHIVTIRSTNSKNIASTSNAISFDKIEIAGTPISAEGIEVEDFTTTLQSVVGNNVGTAKVFVGSPDATSPNLRSVSVRIEYNAGAGANRKYIYKTYVHKKGASQ